MRMKKLAAIVAIAVACSALVGCSGGGADGYKDGTYRAEEAEYSRDYKEFVEITISGGKITSVVADAIKNDNATLKTQDAEYRKNYAGTGNDTTPDVFYPSLAQQLLKSGSVEKVETVAGATNSSANFKRLASAALSKAQEGVQGTTLVISPSEPGSDSTGASSPASGAESAASEPAASSSSK